MKFIAINKSENIGIIYFKVSNTMEQLFYTCDFDISKAESITKDQVLNRITEKMDSLLKLNDIKGLYIFEPNLLNLIQYMVGDRNKNNKIKENIDEMKASIKEQINEQLKKIKG